ncbi:biotin synthase BioB [Propioniciclava flava]
MDRDIERVFGIAEALKHEHPDVELCACLGLLRDGQAERLAEAGIDAYNHNINTAESHHDEIVSTHHYSDRVETIEKVKRAGVSACSGLIVGLGETDAQIVEALLALRDLGADSIPINFLVPFDGTPRAGQWELTPLRCLTIVALARLACPDTEIRLAGGREIHLRGLQGMALHAANSLFLGDYLTAEGQAAADDLALIADNGFTVEDHSLEPGRFRGSHRRAGARSGHRSPPERLTGARAACRRRGHGGGGRLAWTCPHPVHAGRRKDPTHAANAQRRHPRARRCGLDRHPRGVGRQASRSRRGRLHRSVETLQGISRSSSGTSTWPLRGIQHLRNEFCIQVTGVVDARTPENVNPTIPTGEVEVAIRELEVLNPSAPLPFQIRPAHHRGGRLARLKYRYLDLRRPRQHDALVLRSKVTHVIRDVVDDLDFYDVETPTLTHSTPEGARDFLVPHGCTLASGTRCPKARSCSSNCSWWLSKERYPQDRALYPRQGLPCRHRQPEFTQLDVEMSFVDQDDVIAVAEADHRRVLEAHRG